MDQIRPPLGFERGVVLPTRADPTGVAGPTARQIARGEVRRTTRGFYVSADVEPTLLQRIGEVGAILPPRAAVTGWGSLAWRHATWFTGVRVDAETPLPVPVAASRQLLRVQPAFTLCRERWDPREVEVVDGLEVTTPVRSICFAMRYARDPEAAIRHLAMAYFDDLVTPEEVREWANRHPSYTGIEQCRRAPDHADENAWSPMEVDQQLDWTRVTGRRPLLNRPLFDLSGQHIGTPDLVDPIAGVVGQYDSALHLTGERRAADLRRDHLFDVHGLRTVIMVSSDRLDPDDYHARLRAAYALAARWPATDRAFTLELPPWWPPTFTVAQRRALSDADRQRWLRRGAPRAG